MKDLMLEFWNDTKAMAKANPWKVGALIVVSLWVGWLLG